MISERPPVNRVLVNAEEQDDHIESVTVFQANAEVKRRVFLELKVYISCRYLLIRSH